MSHHQRGLRSAAGRRPAVAGVAGATLMARVGKDDHRRCLDREHVREMDFTGKPMAGYVYVEPPGIASQEQLDFWLQLCRQFASTLPPKVG